MIKKIAWNTFKNTGDINTYLELKQFENIENSLNVENIDNINEKKDIKKDVKRESKWNNTIGE